MKEGHLSLLLKVAEDHCWLSLDGTASRTASVEVSSENPQLRGNAPSEAAWATWLYSTGHATACSHIQAVAAVVTSMDTCVGGNRNQDSWAARKVQKELLATLESTLGKGAFYPNARCTFAELQQDTVLDTAREAVEGGAESVWKTLRGLREPFEAMLECAGLTVLGEKDESERGVLGLCCDEAKGEDQSDIKAAVNGSSAVGTAHHHSIDPAVDCGPHMPHENEQLQCTVRQHANSTAVPSGPQALLQGAAGAADSQPGQDVRKSGADITAAKLLHEGCPEFMPGRPESQAAPAAAGELQGSNRRTRHQLDACPESQPCVGHRGGSSTVVAPHCGAAVSWGTSDLDQMSGFSRSNEGCTPVAIAAPQARGAAKCGGPEAGATGVVEVECSAEEGSRASSVRACVLEAVLPEPWQSQQDTELLVAVSEKHAWSINTRSIGQLDVSPVCSSNGCRLWYPYWFAAVYLLDTAEVLAEEFPNVLGDATVAAEVQALAASALRIMSLGPLHFYRCVPGGTTIRPFNTCLPECSYHSGAKY
jgi:hypothetical protein